MKKAFTMLEIVFVLVVIGIIAALIIPRNARNDVLERAVEVNSQIRYAQELAMRSDQYNAANPDWFRNRWHIKFSGTNNVKYSIMRNNIFGGTSGIDIYAKNPQVPDTELKEVELEKITKVSLQGSCANQTEISFDYSGRPYVGSLKNVGSNLDNLMTSECIIVISGANISQTIKIAPETGYSRIISDYR